jgi:Tfp pilus assembly protein PilF
MRFRDIHRAPLLALAITAPGLLAAGPTPGRAGDLRRGDRAPAVELRGVDGTAVSTAGRPGRALLLMFGDAAEDRTQLACARAAALLRSEPLVDEPIDWIVVLTGTSDPARLEPGPMGAGPSPIVVIDRERAAFAAYQVVVAPSLVIVDGSGRVAHAMAGLTDRFADVVHDGLLLALRRLDEAEFDRRLALSDSALPDEVRAKADRVAALARRLQRRGFLDMARAEYERALGIDPAHAAARLGLGNLLLARERPQEAEPHFRVVLAADPRSSMAALGVAECALRRGGDGEAEAAEALRSVLERDPLEPRGHFLHGLLCERRGEIEAAAASFKRAALLLLEDRGGGRSAAHAADVEGGGG